MNEDPPTQISSEAVADSDTPPPGPLASGESPKSQWWSRVPTWGWVAMTVAAILLAFTATALSVIRLPYYTISPGDAFDVSAQIEVAGESADDSPGEVLLLFVRQRSQINGWRYIQAKLDDDIDLIEEEAISGGLSPGDVNEVAEAEMTASQTAAKKVAMEQLGLEVSIEGGLDVLAVLSGQPADGALEEGDVLLEADGTPVITVADLRRVLAEKTPGDEVELLVRREGEEILVTVGTEEDAIGRPAMGILVSDRYAFPVDVEIDTGSISGPSAGLAMTISVLDALSPADLTGGLVVAVTGEIDGEGEVGTIGGIGQKTVSARANGAELMLVPEEEVDDAKARAKGLEVVGVADIDEALDALEAAGGEPLVPPDLGELMAA